MGFERRSLAFRPVNRNKKISVQPVDRGLDLALCISRTNPKALDAVADVLFSKPFSCMPPPPPSICPPPTLDDHPYILSPPTYAFRFCVFLRLFATLVGCFPLFGFPVSPWRILGPHCTGVTLSLVPISPNHSSHISTHARYNGTPSRLTIRCIRFFLGRYSTN